MTKLVCIPQLKVAVKTKNSRFFEIFYSKYKHIESEILIETINDMSSGIV